MKYIRMKDGGIFRIDNDKISVVNSCQFVSIRGGTLHALDVKDKVADTIEELCDEIVEVIDGKAQVVYADISFNDLAIAKIRDKNNAIVYGAIWTDRGLIYVAKMNDKGELELL